LTNKTGTGTLNITGNNSGYSGTFTQSAGNTVVTTNTFNSKHTINGGTLEFGTGTVLSGNTKVSLGGSGTLALTGNDTLSFGLDFLSGSGSTNKTGTGALNITGSNSGYLGRFVQSGGKTVVTSESLGGLHNISGGSILEFGTNASFTSGSSYEINSATMTISASNDLTINGQVSGTSGSIINKTGVGILNINASNSGYVGRFLQSGGKTVVTSASLGGLHNISGGSILEFGTNASFTSGSSYEINSATMTISASNDLTLNGQVSGTSGSIINKTGTGTLNITGTNSGY
jgi:hypothetical protein